MQHRPPFTPAVARLVPEARGPSRRYRPLVAGVAILERSLGDSLWTVGIACDRLLVPRAPRGAAALERLVSRRTARGVICRIGVALAGPLDAPSPMIGRMAGPPWPASTPRPRLDFYGWALLYQPPGMRGRAVVDADSRFADLPAVFELPLELIDRAEFLESRGFRTRPLVIPALPADFIPDLDGRLRNRFFPHAHFRRPCRLDGLL